MFCFCTLLLTIAKAMILRWIGVVMPEGQTQMPLLTSNNSENDDEERGTDGYVIEMYPF